MPTKPPGETSSTLSRIRSSLDDLKSQIVDLEALTNCARKTAELLPYVPRPDRHSKAKTADVLADEVEARRNYGRLQSLVYAVADMATEVMEACEDAIDRAAEDPNDDDNGGGSGQSSGPGGPGALTRGHGGTPPLLMTPAQPISTPIPPLA